MKLSKKKNKDWYNLVICLLALSCPSSKDELNLQVMKVNLSWSYIRDKQAHYAIKMVKIWAHIFGGYKLWKTFWSLCCKIYGKLVKEIGLTKVPTNCASQYNRKFLTDGRCNFKFWNKVWKLWSNCLLFSPTNESFKIPGVNSWFEAVNLV